jgi:5-methylthioadenosine/S-adenosylhomocysteine deaminase
MDAAATLAVGDVLVEGTRIAAVGAAAATRLAALPSGRADTVVDAGGCLVLPGFVQGHLHLCQTLFRGRAEHTDLLRWLREAIWPFEAAHNEASVTGSARLGALELIAGGVTCVNDMGTVRHTEATGAVLEECGLRAVFGKALMDRGEGAPRDFVENTQHALEDGLALVRRFHRAAGDRLRVSLAPRFILSCSDELWQGVRAASERERLIVHTHLAESPGEGRAVEAAVGSTAARYFDSRGMLGPRFVAAHGVWLDDDECRSVHRADAALVHCPGSNLKLGSGLARVRAWRRAGIRCGIGSDGAACNNRLDTFHEMSLASGVSRVVDAADPLAARDVLALATCDGAAALGWSDAIGSIETGKQADLIVVDATGAHVAPWADRDPYVALVEAARPTDVRLTMVAGRVLYRDGQWTTLDPGRVIADARMEARGLMRRVAAA